MRRPLARRSLASRRRDATKTDTPTVVVERGADGETIVLRVEVQPKATPPAPVDARPQLTGTLFDWREHYDPLMKRQARRLARRDRRRLWRRVVEASRLRALLVLGALWIVRVSRGD